MLQVFKELNADLIEEVNQVRRYRNWSRTDAGLRNPPPLIQKRHLDV